MPRRRKGPGGARKGAGRKPVTGVTRSEVRTVKLTPDEANAQDAAAAAEQQPWSEWMRAAAELAIARGSTR